MKKIISGILTLSLAIILFANTVHAESLTYKIDPELQQLIESLMEADASNKDYIEAAINNFNKNNKATDADYNTYLKEIIASIQNLQNESDKSLQSAYEKQEELIKNTPSPTASWQDLYTSAIADYRLGMKYVKLKGATHTADYMNHAIVPMDKVYTSWKPSTVYHKGDAWAKFLTQNQAFTNDIYPKFEQKIIVPGKSYGTITGSFAYTTNNSSLDAFAALHKVNYSATFNKLSSGGYSVAFKITDTYDFDWSTYDNFAIGFGNNYCYVMQSNGWIKPFQIVITANG